MSTINTGHKNILEDDVTNLDHGSKEGAYINELQQEYSMNDDLLNDNIEVYDDVVKNYENNLSKYFQNITDRPSLNNLEDVEYIIDDEYVDENLSNIDSIDDSNENIDSTEKFLQQKPVICAAMMSLVLMLGMINLWELIIVHHIPAA